MPAAAIDRVTPTTGEGSVSRPFFINTGVKPQLNAASKPNVDIKLTNISAFNYPNSGQKMVVVTFDQSFRSNALNNKMRKRQYWIFENQNWKIIYEGSA